MNRLVRGSLYISVFSGLLLSSSFSMANVADKLKVAIASDVRSQAEVDRDKNRKPAQTLAFFGLEDDMSVVELIPGGGWYTKLLVPILAEKGSYAAAIGTSRIEKNLSTLPGFERMTITAQDAELWREDGARFYSLKIDSLGVENADMVLTFRNYHNFGDQGREAMNKAAFEALKPGGIYGVIDHTARHMEPMTPSNRRRFDPVKAIKEIQDAGFVLVDYSSLHHREDDELEYEVGARSVSGNTDRWTLKFMKPE
ncbi:class I SAM-dependent methyltransferase [Agaribacter marinus]|uniref:Methyltransferase n=1 Tax=Agaribacter marinus TaxID=1431249 RepID=A0AA37SYC0_9ALTE|nr:methyltransferase [Agaribacter marinus]GLR71362.1 methyltransferase [Agaribacter marinus]